MRSCIESLWSNSALARSVQFSSLPTSASIFLINLWYAHLENLLIIKDCEEKNMVLDKYIKIPFPILKNKLIPQSKKVSSNSLIKNMHSILEIDWNIRKGTFDSKLLLENFILKF